MFVTSKVWDSESEPWVFDLRGGRLFSLVHCFSYKYIHVQVSDKYRWHFFSSQWPYFKECRYILHIEDDHLKKAHLCSLGLWFMTQTWPSFSDRVISLKTSCSGDGFSMPETCSGTRLSISLAQFQKAQQNAKHVSNVLSRPDRTALTTH